MMKASTRKKKTYTVHPAPGVGDFHTLALAIAKVPAGSTIRLSPGGHKVAEPLRIKKQVTLIGAGCGRTYIVGDVPWYVVVLDGGANIEMRDITFRHASDQAANVVEVLAANVRMIRCMFCEARGWQSPGDGFGLYIHATARVVLRSCGGYSNGVGWLAVEDGAQVRISQ